VTSAVTQYQQYIGHCLLSEVYLIYTGFWVLAFCADEEGNNAIHEDHFRFKSPNINPTEKWERCQGPKQCSTP
jgi:hypothetical protein